ncbi:MAG: YadA-like family protein [Polaromonas sp.]|nr:YadA-like family protein [Polaromonas sp.]
MAVNSLWWARLLHQLTRVGAAEARIAVTESRLNSTDTRLAVSDQRTTTLENKVAVMGDQISDVRQESRRGIAAAAALVMSNPALAKGETSLDAGVASYRGQAAIGIGVTHRLNEAVTINGGVFPPLVRATRLCVWAQAGSSKLYCQLELFRALYPVKPTSNKPLLVGFLV